MASNSEANLSSDFDIDEVINWDEQNYSSKVNNHSLFDEETHKIRSWTRARVPPLISTRQYTNGRQAFFDRIVHSHYVQSSLQIH